MGDAFAAGDDRRLRLQDGLKDVTGRGCSGTSDRAGFQGLALIGWLTGVALRGAGPNDDGAETYRSGSACDQNMRVDRVRAIEPDCILVLCQGEKAGDWI